MRFKYLFWLVPLVLFLLQAVYTLNSLNQIRYEEIEESISNPFFVQNRYVVNGAAANVGWHFLMVVAYNLFGFSLFAGKFVRLILFGVFLVSLSLILRRFLGEKKAIVPLVTIGLSPTLLYFNTQETAYGLDLLFFPICLLVLFAIKFEKTFLDFAKQAFLGLLLMVAWLSYPSFIYFWPALLGFYFWRLVHSIRHSRPSSVIPAKAGIHSGQARGNLGSGFRVPSVSLRASKHGMTNKSLFLLIPVISFLIPLVAVLAFIKNRSLLIWDENVRSGIFRGAGFLQFDFGTFFTNLKHVLENLFVRSFGYYFELKKVEFSDFYPMVGVVLVLFLTFKIWKEKKDWRPLIFLAVSVLILNILLAFFTVDPTPGMRRYSGFLISFYILFVLAWKYVSSFKKSGKKVLLIGALLILGLHNLVVFPINLGHIGDPSQFAERLWFGREGNPPATFDKYIDTIKRQDMTLMCSDVAGETVNCSYSGPYTAISAACLYNGLKCGGIYGWDVGENSFVKLNLDLFRGYYFGRYGKEIKSF